MFAKETTAVKAQPMPSSNFISICDFFWVSNFGCEPTIFFSENQVVLGLGEFIEQ